MSLSTKDDLNITLNAPRRSKTEKVCAITTAYFPDPETIKKLIETTLPQVHTLVIVNNGGDILRVLNDLKVTSPQIVHLTKNENIGTAGAFNLGAEWAFQRDFTHILLLDQDSELAPNMIAVLLSQLNELESKGEKVAVIGPQFIYKNGLHPVAFIKHHSLFVDRIVRQPDDKRWVDVSYIISSGSLISKEAWVQVGPKDEGLFLDLTDIEWGIRATTKNWKVIGSFQAKMFHQIGDSQVNLAGRKVNLHGPIRHYYFFRNCMNLLSRKYVPLNIRINLALKILPRFFIYAVFGENKLEQWKMMVVGFWHGFQGKLGKYGN